MARPRTAIRAIPSALSVLRSPFCVPLLLLAAWGSLSCGRMTAGETTTIELWGLGREGEVVVALLPEFERLHPDIRVRVQQIPWTAAHEKLLTAFVGDSTPDLAQMGNTWVPEFEAIRALENLDPWIAASPGIDPGHYFEGIWATNEVDGSTYGVPWYVDTRLLFYRTDVFRDAGWNEPPKTWDEWIRLMDSIREKELTRWPAFFATNEWQPPVILGLQTGSTILADDGTRGDFTSPEFRRAFEFYVGLFERGYAPKLSYHQIANVYQQFAEKDFSMLITGPWNVGEFRRRLPAELQDSWSTAPMPAPPEKSWPGASVAGGSSLVVFERSNKKEAAWKLIEYLSRPEVQVEFYELTGNLPAREGAWDAPVFVKDREMRAFRTQLENAIPTPKVPEWEQIAAEVWQHAEMVIRGDVPSSRALALLDAKAGAILEKRRWMLERERRGE
ncbi:MAG TPA: sugar ABC transporter substrate-binding protein [Thermoanaerobaculia bacterium]|nr:sugar ABC transporter substrate-binding protein [Thermoanaerobaculia bacterium]